MMKGGESGSTSPATARITKKGAPTHSSSSSTATGAATGMPASASACCTRAWRVRSYTGKMPPPAGGSRATSRSFVLTALLVPHDVDEQRLARVAGGRPLAGAPRARRRRRGREARSQRSRPLRTASRSRCPAATVMTASRPEPGGARGGWRRTRRAGLRRRTRSSTGTPPRAPVATRRGRPSPSARPAGRAC